MQRTSSLLLLCVLVQSSCGSNAPETPREAPRPVEVYALREVDPAGPLELTGSVTSWKEQDIAFEVGGRVKFIQEPGTVLEGRWEDGAEVRVKGELLAELDDQPFQIAVASAEASVSVARENVAVVAAQLDKLLPANLTAAIAEEKLAEAEYQRFVEAGKTNAVSEVDVLRAEAGKNVTSAKVDQARAAFASREAEKRSLEANLAQAGQQLEDARWKLERCRLFAPFTGEVSEVFVEAGGFVQSGQAAAHLVMMDPVQVDVAVSESTLRRLERYAEVLLAVSGVEEPMTGRIYELATVADERTRTFRVSIIVRNQSRIGTLGSGDPDTALPRIQNALVPLRIDPYDPTSPLCVESRMSLHEDDQGWFVWVSSDPVLAEELDRDRPVFTVKKARVTPGERVVNYQGIYVMRELADPGELTESSLLPLGLPVDFPEGEKVLLADSRWMLRPGQIVNVLLADSAPGPGLFVPMSIVLPMGDDVGRVFVVEGDQARSVRIDTSDRVGPLVRVQPIDPADAELVGPGAQVIRQAHYLTEGEKIRVVRTHEVRP